MNRLSFVLPVTLQESGAGVKTWRKNPDDGSKLRISLLLRSFVTMFEQDGLEYFFLICPEKDIPEISRLLGSITTDPRYCIISEMDICPEIRKMKNMETGQIEGWYAQQLIKLAIAERIATEFYVTLDSDIFCLRPFSVRDLFFRKKALLNIERKRDYKRTYNKAFAKKELHIKNKRYNNSGLIIGYRRPLIKKHLFYGETPVIMHSKSVRELAVHITARFDSPWRTVLAETRTWTEYTLYFQFLEMTKKLDTIYWKTGCNALLHLEKSVWHASDCYKLRRTYDKAHFMGTLHKEKHGFFIAVQSWLDTSSWLPPHYTSLNDFYAEVEMWLFDINSH